MTEDETMKCHRTACTNQHDNCRHTQTGNLYCEACAVRINRGNPEVSRLVTIPRLAETAIVQLPSFDGVAAFHVVLGEEDSPDEDRPY